LDRLHVATLNIRNLADRWFERLPLLLADMAALQPDLLGLQEVVYVLQQDRVIGAAGEPKRLWVVDSSDHRFSDRLDEFDKTLLEAIGWVNEHAPR